MLVAVGSVLGVPAGERLLVAVVIGFAVVPWFIGALTRTRAGWWRTTLTLACVAVVNLGGGRWGWLGETAGGQLSLFLGVGLVFQHAVVATRRLAAVSLIAVAGIIVGRDLLDPSFDAVFTWLLGLVMAGVGGIMARRMAETIERLRAAEGQLAAEAVGAEQRRIARDVHDIVAHSLSVTALHLSAARMAAARADLEETRDALEDAESLTRSSLDEIRRTVNLLRGSHSDDGVDPTAPVPGVDDIESLTASFRAAGLDCVLVRTGDCDVSALVGVTVYRIVQEALTNAARHLPGSSTVVALDVGADHLHAEVRSRGRPPPPVGSGFGLVGMRERVESAGGRFTAGPEPDGWRVSVTLPLGNERQAP